MSDSQTPPPHAPAQEPAKEAQDIVRTQRVNQTSANATFIPADPDAPKYIGSMPTLLINENGNLTNTVSNAIEIMKASPSFASLRKNVLSGKVEYAGVPVLDNTITAMERWFASHGLGLGRTHIRNALEIVAPDYNPVTEYLDQL